MRFGAPIGSSEVCLAAVERVRAPEMWRLRTLQTASKAIERQTGILEYQNKLLTVRAAEEEEVDGLTLFIKSGIVILTTGNEAMGNLFKTCLLL